LGWVTGFVLFQLVLMYLTAGVSAAGEAASPILRAVVSFLDLGGEILGMVGRALGRLAAPIGRLLVGAGRFVEHIPGVGRVFTRFAEAVRALLRFGREAGGAVVGGVRRVTDPLGAAAMRAAGLPEHAIAGALGHAAPHAVSSAASRAERAAVGDAAERGVGGALDDAAGRAARESEEAAAREARAASREASQASDAARDVPASPPAAANDAASSAQEAADAAARAREAAEVARAREAAAVAAGQPVPLDARRARVAAEAAAVEAENAAALARQASELAEARRVADELAAEAARAREAADAAAAGSDQLAALRTRRAAERAEAAAERAAAEAEEAAAREAGLADDFGGGSGGSGGGGQRVVVDGNNVRVVSDAPAPRELPTAAPRADASPVAALDPRASPDLHPAPEVLPSPDLTPTPLAEPVPVPVPESVPHPDRLPLAPPQVEVPPVGAPDIGRAAGRAITHPLLAHNNAPGTTPAPTPTPTPSPAPAPAPGTNPPNNQACNGPTGLTPQDPIPIQWFKPFTDNTLYPSPIELDGVEYSKWDRGHMPRGEPIGVSRIYRPFIGKLVQLVPEPRPRNFDPISGRWDSMTGRFREALTYYGFDWGAHRHLQVDHVMDLQWSPVGSAFNNDVFNNMWPLDGAANMSAGSAQNNNQLVTFCETPTGPHRHQISLRQMKAEARANPAQQFFGRYFIITSISL
jgi:hypothetical protein